tara:strand:- start:6208 stop:6756 length:549 start_codon:yes stop_codon:yes gene_type:complete
MHKNNLNIFCFITNFDEDYIKNLDKNVNIIFRNYKDPLNINKLKKLKNFCKSINKKVFLANNIKLALSLKFDGVYIPSFNKKVNFLLNKNIYNFIVLGSAHNLREIKIKENQGVNLIFIAPIFKVTKSDKFLGQTRFNILTLLTNKKIIALGGFNSSNLNKLNLIRASGFAGISYFQKKTAP